MLAGKSHAKSNYYFRLSDLSYTESEGKFPHIGLVRPLARSYVMTRGPNGSHHIAAQGRSCVSSDDQLEADSNRNPGLICNDCHDVVFEPNSRFRLASGVCFGAKVELGCPQMKGANNA